MASPSMIILPLILFTFLFSYQGFKNHMLIDQYAFDVEKVLVGKEYKRLITSGFFHINWFHLVFNMLTFYFFSGSIITALGVLGLLILYFGGITVGNLVALWIHKNHGSYRSMGASGGVYALIFGGIALFPGMKIGLFLLPFSMPTWLFGLIFLGFSIYAIRSKRDNVGHEAHLGGALAGIIMAILMVPSVVERNYLPILAVLIPILAIIYIIAYKPQLLMVDSLHFKTTHKLTIDQKFNLEKKQQQVNIDRILEKIHRRGINSLTREEKQQLEEYSRKG
jgi:membrane associated rhomboid family serine protease